MVKAERRSDSRHTTTTAEVMRENFERVLYQSDGVQTDGTRERSVQASCGIRGAEKATSARPGLGVPGVSSLARDGVVETRLADDGG